MASCRSMVSAVISAGAKMVARRSHHMSPSLNIRRSYVRMKMDDLPPAIPEEGFDLHHWHVAVCTPPPLHVTKTRDHLVQYYVDTLAQVLGSEEEAREKMYFVITDLARCSCAFGANVPKELAEKLQDLPNVSFVLPDAYLDFDNKKYGGEPFIDGQAVPYDREAYEKWRKSCLRSPARRTARVFKLGS